MSELNSKRESGYYWAKLDNKWIVAFYKGNDDWALDTYWCGDDHFDEINETRIPSPEETIVLKSSIFDEVERSRALEIITHQEIRMSDELVNDADFGICHMIEADVERIIDAMIQFARELIQKHMK